jgi:WD40 repeat protein
MASIKPTGFIRAIRCPHQRRVVTALRDKTVRIWDIAAAKTIAVLAGNTADVWAANFSPDGLHLVTASFDQTARI